MKTLFKISLISWLLLSFLVQAQGTSTTNNSTVKTSNEEAKVTGLRYNNVHVLQLEKSLTLYQEILGFELTKAEVLKGNLAGMLVLTIEANDYAMTLTVTPPKYQHNLKPVGNTNHNHFMLVVNDIKTIGDKLKAAGYALENENYAKDLYTFFEG